MPTLSISAKCGDTFSAVLTEEGQANKEYVGDVPRWLSPKGYGDYVELKIDLETGTIIGWKPPSKKQLAETFNGEEEE